MPPNLRIQPTPRCTRFAAGEARAVGRLDRHRRTQTMKRALLVFLLLNLFLSACTPVAPTPVTSSPPAWLPTR